MKRPTYIIDTLDSTYCIILRNSNASVYNLLYSLLSSFWRRQYYTSFFFSTRILYFLKLSVYDYYDDHVLIGGKKNIH
ncbi:unnamed protein product [Amoebophrya sp. A25]|nr:unnamed protein product [Amoebophrya sp. A25]|eukprot:GSA25T00011157001.1